MRKNGSAQGVNLSSIEPETPSEGAAKPDIEKHLVAKTETQRDSKTNVVDSESYKSSTTEVAA